MSERERLQQGFAALAARIEPTLAQCRKPVREANEWAAVLAGLDDLASGRVCVVSQQEFKRLHELAVAEELRAEANPAEEPNGEGADTA